MTDDTSDLVYRLKKRAEIRRQITTRKSVQENEPDRIADLLEEAAEELAAARQVIKSIAFERLELSHDKVRWQADDHIRWCTKFLQARGIK